MQQELMRAVALLIAGRGADLSKAESAELANLGRLLARASRAQAGTDPRVLEATASGKPMPPEK